MSVWDTSRTGRRTGPHRLVRAWRSEWDMIRLCPAGLREHDLIQHLDAEAKPERQTGSPATSHRPPPKAR
jgi:hypothetical protein